MSHLHVRKNGSKAWLYLVLGNEADEIPADWSARLPLAVDLDVAVDRYRDIWENKPVPTKLA